ncbi:lipoyl synthase [Prosthecochloris sp. HL-130-GSB]|jgi:lipoyl synthase|nr:lipoyl synthase [Prosthecochloris sp. HL-130-GSB]
MKPQRKPEWLKLRLSGTGDFASTKRLIAGYGLNTVCRSALCPNLHECWSSGTATFMLLGNSCTRNCRFCAITTHSSLPAPDPEEPGKIAEAVKKMKLRHVVLTSVTRDDLGDGGSGAWAETVEAVRKINPETTIECLIPDFQGNRTALQRVMELRPDILNHNVETVPSLYKAVRPEADYRQSLEVLAMAAGEFGLISKSGMMVGMGESPEEVKGVLDDLVRHGCRHVTIGQYLQPTARHHEVTRYVTPEEFDEYRTYAEHAGFCNIQSGPFVRSSYHAAESLAEPVTNN